MIIDIHGHISPPEMLKKFPMPPSLGDIEGMIEQKASLGIDLTVVGSPVGAGAMMRVPGIDNYDQPIDKLRAFHDWLTATVGEHAGRLKAYVYANPLGGDEHLEAAAETLQGDAFVGFIVNTSVKGAYLDTAEADSFFAMAAGLRAPVLLHPPAAPVGSEALRNFRLVEQVGRFCDVTIGLAAILFAGWQEKYPHLRLIAGTAGGAISMLPAKLDLAWRPVHWGPELAGRPGGPPDAETHTNRPPSEHLAEIYVDTASPSRHSLIANLDAMGPQRLLFGTDSPPLATPLQTALDSVNELPLSEHDKERILAGNALDLFGPRLLSGRPGTT